MSDIFISLHLLTCKEIKKLFKNLNKLGLIDKVKNINKFIKYQFNGELLSAITCIEELLILDLSFEEVNIIFFQMYGVYKIYLEKNIFLKNEKNEYYEKNLINIISRAKIEKSIYKNVLKPFLKQT